jgi:hypothetical protein
MSDHNPYAAPKAVVADVFVTEAAPPLWNPTAAGAWSLLFSPIFGAFLHMQNWKALGRPEKAAASKKWMLGSIVFLVAMMLSTLFLPESRVMDKAGNLGSLVLLIVWYYAIGKSQQTYVAARFGKTYPRRGWAVPLVVALAIFVAVICSAILLAGVLMATGVIPAVT